ncbi:MAG: hypothetical protein Tsb0014_21270 [Pleurocapsa sp.]
MILKKIAITVLPLITLLGLPLEAISIESKLESDLLKKQPDLYLDNQEKSNQDKYLKPVENTEFKPDVDLQFIGSRIIATFAPQNQQGEAIELAELASNLGYDHFNWVSYVEKDPYGITNQAGQILSTPYNDPPQGGYQYEAADSLPFYWDMTKCDRCNPYHQYQNPRFTKQFELVFEDAPSDYRLQPGETIEFVTHLVGVKNYDPQTNQAQWDVVNSFRWQLTNSPSGQGRVSLLEANLNLNNLSLFLLSEMQADGAIFPQTVVRGTSQQKFK